MADQEIWLGKSEELADKIVGPIHCICTDPPYGMDFKSNQAETAAGKKWVKKIENDDDPVKAIMKFMEVMDILIPKLADDADVYVFCRWSLIPEWMDMLGGMFPCKSSSVPELNMHRPENMLIWDKGTPGMGDLEGNWPFTWEAILYGKKGRVKIARRRPSVISIPRIDKDNHIHPTEKPIQLMEVLIGQSTQVGDLVVDPFAGSGATIHAARNLGRRGIGIEYDPEFHARAVTRLNERTLL